MKRLLYLATLLMAASLIFAPAALAQDVDCPQLTFEEAQAILAADPSDPNRLDADNDGIACDRSNTLPSEPKMEEKMEMKSEEKMEMKSEEKEKGKEKEKMKEEKKEMPKTGGAAVGSLLGLGAGALLVGGGLIALKRRNS